MCILRDGTMCVLLSAREQLAQHNFEERKGPYPKALADRLHDAGIMTRERHFRESLLRRRENVEDQLRWLTSFSIRMDCSDEERDYMLGNRHELSMDMFLPPELAQQMMERFTRVRKQRFRIYLHSYGEAKDAAFLLAYPEFSDWFGEFSSNFKASNQNVNFMVDGLLEAPELLTKVVDVASESVLRMVCALVFHRFFNVGFLVKKPGMLETVAASVPEQHRKQFNLVVDAWQRLIATPDTNLFSRKLRRQRKALGKKMHLWALAMRDDPSIATDTIQDMVRRLLVARTATFPAALPLAA